MSTMSPDATTHFWKGRFGPRDWEIESVHNGLFGDRTTNEGSPGLDCVDDSGIKFVVGRGRTYPYFRRVTRGTKVGTEGERGGR